VVFGTCGIKNLKYRFPVGLSHIGNKTQNANNGEGRKDVQALVRHHQPTMEKCEGRKNLPLAQI